MTFFSEFQSKFPATYSGQYVEAIIKSIANARISNGEKLPKILLPFFSHLKINVRNIIELSIESESSFSGSSQERRADLLVRFELTNGRTGAIFIEIKVDDKIIGSKNPGENDQLDDYLTAINSNKMMDNYFILLTAYPIEKNYLNKLKNFNQQASHLYIGDYGRNFSGIDDLSAEGMFYSYLIEKGYAMFVPNDDDKNDFLSFMIMNFLRHQSGHGRAVSDRKISNGPIVFSKLVKNWQLISYRLNACIKSNGVPAIRYLPEQIVKAKIEPQDTFVGHRMRMREARESGRMWLISEVVVKNQTRLSWTVIYSISHREENNDYNYSPINCQHVVSLRTGKDIHCEIESKKTSFHEYSNIPPEAIIDDILEAIRCIEKQVNMDLIDQ